MLKTHRAIADGSPANTVTLQQLPPPRPQIIADVNIITRIMLLSFNKVVVVFIIGAIAHTIHEIATVEGRRRSSAGHEKILVSLSNVISNDFLLRPPHNY